MESERREIKFRGKSIEDDNQGEWVYGFYVIEGGDYCIASPTETVTNRYWMVDPDTIGQYTGMKDDEGEGVEIYEGDIVRASYFGIGGDTNLGVYETEEEITGEIRLSNLSLQIKGITDKNGKWQEYTGYKQGEGETAFYYLGDMYEGSQSAEIGVKVIGNIHDGVKEAVNEQR